MSTRDDTDPSPLTADDIATMAARVSDLRMLRDDGARLTPIVQCYLVDVARLLAAIADPWQDIGDGIAIRRERGRVVEVRVASASLSPPIAYSLGAVDEKRGSGVLCMVGAWEQIGEAWYIRVREQ